MIECSHTPDLKAIVALQGMCGLRVSEAIGIDPKDYDPVTKRLVVRGKGDKYRVVPVSDEAALYLAPVWLPARLDGGSRITHFSDSNLRRLITVTGRRAKLSQRVSSHNLRATFATSLYASCKDKKLVQDILGHSDGRTTDIYIEVAMSYMLEEVNKL